MLLVRSLLSSRLELAKEAASMQKGSGTAQANSKPPVIGPRNSIMTTSLPIIRPLATVSTSRSTTWGTRICVELRKNVSHVPIRKKQAYSSIRSTWCSRTSSEKTPSSVARNASTRTIVRRRSTRSLSTPAGRLKIR
jgi:hypothetical protein